MNPKGNKQIELCNKLKIDIKKRIKLDNFDF